MSGADAASGRKATRPPRSATTPGERTHGLPPPRPVSRTLLIAAAAVIVTLPTLTSLVVMYLGRPAASVSSSVPASQRPAATTAPPVPLPDKVQLQPQLERFWGDFHRVQPRPERATVEDLALVTCAHAAARGMRAAIEQTGTEGRAAGLTIDELGAVIGIAVSTVCPEHSDDLIGPPGSAP